MIVDPISREFWRSPGLSFARPALIPIVAAGFRATHLAEHDEHREPARNSASPRGFSRNVLEAESTWSSCAVAGDAPRRFGDRVLARSLPAMEGAPRVCGAYSKAAAFVPCVVDRRVVRTRPPPPLSARRRPRGLRPSGNGCECPTPSLQPSAPTVTCPIAPPDYRTCSLGSARAPSVRSSFAYSCSSALRREARLHVS